MPNEEKIAECMQNCRDCAEECFRCMNHCLQMGGDHAGLDHQRTLQDCATICNTSWNFMSRKSPRHVAVCGVCADICTATADSCEKLSEGDEQMDRCAQICRTCARSCEEMAGATA